MARAAPLQSCTAVTGRTSALPASSATRSFCLEVSLFAIKAEQPETVYAARCEDRIPGQRPKRPKISQIKKAAILRPSLYRSFSRVICSLTSVFSGQFSGLRHYPANT